MSHSIETQHTTINLIEDESTSKTDFSAEQEHSVYLFPQKLDYPEDDQHQFYYPSDFPNYSHLQMECAYFRLGPIYKQVVASLEYHQHQKIFPAQRPLVNNLKKNLHFVRNLTTYAEFYLDYDLQDPDNQANKQFNFVNPQTGKITKRRT